MAARAAVAYTATAPSVVTVKTRQLTVTDSELAAGAKRRAPATHTYRTLRTQHLVANEPQLNATAVDEPVPGRKDVSFKQQPQSSLQLLPV